MQFHHEINGHRWFLFLHEKRKRMIAVVVFVCHFCGGQVGITYGIVVTYVMNPLRRLVVDDEQCGYYYYYYCCCCLGLRLRRWNADREIVRREVGLDCLSVTLRLDLELARLIHRVFGCAVLKEWMSLSVLTLMLALVQ